MRPPLSYVPALFPLVGFIAGMLVCEMAGYLWIPGGDNIGCSAYCGKCLGSCPLVDVAAGRDAF